MGGQLSRTYGTFAKISSYWLTRVFMNTLSERQLHLTETTHLRALLIAEWQ